MGSGLSIQKNEYDSLKSLYTMKKVLIHCHGVSLKTYSRMLEGDQEERIRIKKFWVTSLVEKQQLENEMTAKQKVSSKYLASIVGAKIKNEGSPLIGVHRGFIIKIAMEDYERNLASEIRKRKEKEELKYKEKDLVSIMSSLVSACLELQAIGYPHKNVAPQNVMFRPDGQVILADDLVLESKWKGSPLNYTMTQQMVQGIGLTVLCAGTLMDYESFFPLERFDSRVFVENLKKMSQGYSSCLVNLVAGIVKIEGPNVTLSNIQNELEYLFDRGSSFRMRPVQEISLDRSRWEEKESPNNSNLLISVIEPLEYCGLGNEPRDSIVSAFNQKSKSNSPSSCKARNGEASTKATEEEFKIKLESLSNAKQPYTPGTAKEEKKLGRIELNKLYKNIGRKEVIRDRSQLPAMKQYNGMDNIEERKSCRSTQSYYSISPERLPSRKKEFKSAFSLVFGAGTGRANTKELVSPFESVFEFEHEE